jgi:hypothetical protein
MTHTMRKVKKFHVLKCWIFDLDSEGFSCSLDVLYGGIGIKKLLFLIGFFPAGDFFTNLFYQNVDSDPH